GIAAAGHPGLLAGATAPNPQVITLRVLAHRIEPVAALLRDVWTAWRHEAWDLRACTPRVWAT
ncbi:MAG: urease accessory protein UreD, partial [Thiomonas sp.]